LGYALVFYVLARLADFWGCVLYVESVGIRQAAVLCLVEGEHSPDEKSVGSHSMFKWVIREEISSGVSGGGLLVNADAQVGGVSGYRQVHEVDSIIVFQFRAKLYVAMDCVDVLQNII